MMIKDHHKKNLFTTTLWDLDHPLNIEKDIYQWWSTSDQKAPWLWSSSGTLKNCVHSRAFEAPLSLSLSQSRFHCHHPCHYHHQHPCHCHVIISNPTQPQSFNDETFHSFHLRHLQSPPSPSWWSSPSPPPPPWPPSNSLHSPVLNLWHRFHLFQALWNPFPPVVSPLKPPPTQITTPVSPLRNAWRQDGRSFFQDHLSIQMKYKIKHAKIEITK